MGSVVGVVCVLLFIVYCMVPTAAVHHIISTYIHFNIYLYILIYMHRNIFLLPTSIVGSKTLYYIKYQSSHTRHILTAGNKNLYAIWVTIYYSIPPREIVVFPLGRL